MSIITSLFYMFLRQYHFLHMARPSVLVMVIVFNQCSSAHGWAKVNPIIYSIKRIHLPWRGLLSAPVRSQLCEDQFYNINSEPLIVSYSKKDNALTAVSSTVGVA